MADAAADATADANLREELAELARSHTEARGLAAAAAVSQATEAASAWRHYPR